MTESDDDWYSKNVDDFEIRLENDEEKHKIGASSSELSNEQIFARLQADNEYAGGHYKTSTYHTAKTKSKQFFRNTSKVVQNFIQKLPTTKLLRILDLPKIQCMIELFLHEDEILELYENSRFNDDTNELLLKILEKVIASPLSEHRRNFLRKVLQYESFLLSCLEKEELNTRLFELLKPQNNLISSFVEAIQTEFIEAPKILSSKKEFTLKPTLISNKIFQESLKSAKLYKHIQLSFLKEEFLCNIRQDLDEYNKRYDKPTEVRFNNISVHPKITLQVGNMFDRGKEIFISRKQSSSNYLHGALLIFTTNLRTMEDLILSVILPAPKRDNIDTSIVPIEIIHCEARDIFNRNFSMIESDMYFDPFHSVFNNIAGVPESLMREFFLSPSTDAQNLPQYINELKNLNYCHRGKIFDVKQLENLELPWFDDAQAKAYKNSLTQKMAIIQGPPGCGKTLLGLEIIETLLKNTNEKIMIICYTNYALDQLMESLTSITDDFVRFGNQSKSVILEKFKAQETDMKKIISNELNKLINGTLESYRNSLEQFIALQNGNVASQKDLEDAQSQMTSWSKKMQEVFQIRKYLLVKERRIFGMTTSYAARSRVLLELISASVVIFEEAAEILESHVLASLPSSTQQLILIGDHEQLQPITNFSRGTSKSDLQMSFFERKIRQTLNFSTLTTQFRMRPEISELIRGSVYSELHDAPNVMCYPNVRGITKNVFFLDHQIPESHSDGETTKTNSFEAKEIACLCYFLLEKGYKESEITILTPYVGQKLLIQKEMRNVEVKVAVIDSFQGHQNKIILLSLVRSNVESSIGYLGIKNRVCVALSRAQEGLFMFGNMKLLASCSEVWCNIRNKLIYHQQIGDILPKK